MIIRPANGKDIKELIRLDNQWKKENISFDFSPSSKQEFRQSVHRDIIFVASINNKIVGYCFAKRKVAKRKIHLIGKGQRYLNLDSLYVSKKYRRGKIASFLIQEIINYAKSNGYKKIKAAAVNYNLLGLINFYQKLGFKCLYGILILDLGKI